MTGALETHSGIQVNRDEVRKQVTEIGLLLENMKQLRGWTFDEWGAVAHSYTWIKILSEALRREK